MSDTLQATKFKLRDVSGNLQEVDFDLRLYQQATDAGITLSQHLNTIYGSQTDETKFGSVMGQFMEHAGMFLSSDPRTGIHPPTLKQIQGDMGKMQLGALTRNDGENRHTPNGRMLFPEIIMRTIEENLRRSDDQFLMAWEKMVAQTITINGTKYDQPTINVTEPENNEAQQISQLTEPAVMVSITTGNYSKNIPTKSIGLMVADQALEATTLDLVNLAMTAQARGEHIRMVKSHLRGILNGDKDLQEAGIASQKFKDFDTALTGNQISHKAWIKYLWDRHEYSSIDVGICDIDMALAIEGRQGKPTRDTVMAKDGTNFPTHMGVELAVKEPMILPLDSDIVGGANTFVGLDSRYGIRRVINVSAAYSAIEQFVMRRAFGLRVDYGEIAHKLYPEAFSKVTATQ